MKMFAITKSFVYYWTILLLAIMFVFYFTSSLKYTCISFGWKSYMAISSLVCATHSLILSLIVADIFAAAWQPIAWQQWWTGV